MADVEEQEARSLPYARQRMLEIARALVRQPKVLLLDEPAAGLNDAEMQELKDRLLRLRSDRLIIVVIEHNMNLVMSLSGPHLRAVDGGQNPLKSGDMLPALRRLPPPPRLARLVGGQLPDRVVARNAGWRCCGGRVKVCA